MRVGVPKEIKDHEDRVGLVPSSVAELVRHGHEVLIQAGAGVGAGLEDALYVAAGGRIVACHLPSKSPWLNPIEPQWVHGKRAVSEPDCLLRAAELEARVYAYYGCERETHLVMPKKVA